MKEINIDNLNNLYITKTIAAIGMLISVLSLLLAVASILPLSPDQVNAETFNQFELWIYSYMVAIPSILFYLIDGIFCFVRTFYKLDKIFNIILGIFILCMVPMVLFVGSWYPGSIIWNIYYFLVFTLEIISIIRAIKQRKNLV